MTALPGSRDCEEATMVDALVAQALDDLDEGRLDTETALRVVAVLAWQAGERYAGSIA
jgi:hypothetical protein